MFMDSSLIHCKIHKYVLTDNGIKFPSKFFESVWDFLDTKNPKTNAYQLQMSWHVERFDKTIIEPLKY